MADTYDVIFQGKPSAGVVTEMILVGAGHTIKGCSLEVVNVGRTVDYFDLYVDNAGTGSSTSKAIHYQVPVAPSLPFSRQAVIFVKAGGKIWFKSNNGNLTVTLFGIDSV